MDDTNVKRSVKIDIDVPDMNSETGAKCTITGLSADVLTILTTTIYRVASKVGITTEEMKTIICKILDNCDAADNAGSDEPSITPINNP